MPSSTAFNADLISVEEAGTLPGLFRHRCERSPEREPYRQFESGAGWQGTTWQEMSALVARWQLALATEGMSVGDRVALSVRNSIEWVCFDQAAQSLGLVVVPLYVTDHVDTIVHVLADSGARLLLVGNIAQWQAIHSQGARLPDLTRVICIEAAAAPNASSSPRPSLLSNWLPYSAPRQHNLARNPHALATIIDTSGTIGPAKGVMLSHHNILSNSAAVLSHQPGHEDDTYLSFLPLSHAFERTAGYYVPMMAGSRVAFARSVEHLAQDIMTIRPSILISVPRVYERVYVKIHQQLETKGTLAKALFKSAVEAGWKRFEADQHRAGEPHWIARTTWPVLQRLVARKLLESLGGRLRLAVTGGAAMSPDLTRQFLALGVPIVQGYGLTEASPVVASNRLIDNVPESVGTALPGVSLRLGDKDELLIRGPNVMLGYWNQPEMTARAVDADGWLHTGDQARIEDNRVFIVGRLKEIIVLSTGEKTAPADPESALTQDALFDQAMVIGEGQPRLVAILVLNPGAWKDLAARWSLDPGDSESLEDSRVHYWVHAACRSRLERFAGHRNPHRKDRGVRPRSSHQYLGLDAHHARTPRGQYGFAGVS